MFFCICPGPVLRAEEGDTLRVTFMNKADRNFSIQPHGLHYDKHFQGTSYEDGEEALHTDTGCTLPAIKYLKLFNLLEL